MQTQDRKLFADFVKGRFAEIPHFEQLVFRPLYEVSNVPNPFAFQTVVGSNRELKIRDQGIELGLQLGFGASRPATSDRMDLTSEFARLNERVEVLAENFRSFDHREFRLERTIRPNLDD
jgi:hypothetical protein